MRGRHVGRPGGANFDERAVRRRCARVGQATFAQERRRDVVSLVGDRLLEAGARERSDGALSPLATLGPMSGLERALRRVVPAARGARERPQRLGPLGGPREEGRGVGEASGRFEGAGVTDEDAPRGETRGRCDDVGLGLRRERRHFVEVALLRRLRHLDRNDHEAALPVEVLGAVRLPLRDQCREAGAAGKRATASAQRAAAESRAASSGLVFGKIARTKIVLATS